MSDVGAKRKYPFELEKAIHNVMFIQHHMQRQDEFNAVSVMQEEKKFKCKLPFFLFYFISLFPAEKVFYYYCYYIAAFNVITVNLFPCISFLDQLCKKFDINRE